MKWAYANLNIMTFLKMHDNQEVILRPDYQREIVWTEHSMAQFVESLLMILPVPQIYFHEKVEESKKILYVIDGQQRLNSIINFCRENMPLNKLEDSPFEGLTFNELQKDTQRLNEFLAYELPVVKIYDEEEKAINKFYARINRNTINLNEQEIRKAMYPGAFLDMAEILAQVPFWKQTSFFTKLQKKRMADIEFVSELLVLEMAGIQDKKNKLSQFYEEYASLKEDEKNKIMKNFMFKINIINKLFRGYDLKKSRFSKQADFYSFFAYLCELQKDQAKELIQHKLTIQNLFSLLKYGIAPQSNIDILKTYAVKCISQANSKASRKWRKDFLGDLINHVVNHQINDTVKALSVDIDEEYELDLQDHLETPLDFKNILNEIRELDRDVH